MRLLFLRPHFPLPIAPWLGRIALAALLLPMVCGFVRAADDEEGIPLPMAPGSFQELYEAPPFRRLLSLSDRLVLSGVAQLPEGEMVTVLNPETRESFVVTRTPNPRGWRLVSLTNDTDLLKVSATLSAGGREITLRFDPSRLRPRSSRSRASPGQGDDVQVVIEALLRRIDPVAADVFEALPPRAQEDFRSSFATYLKAYPETSDANKADFIRETLGELDPDPEPTAADGSNFPDDPDGPGGPDSDDEPDPEPAPR
ncbi:hypothetical protein BH23VER1_BH23VER1_34370 [soil metagenome]